ncbi:hypothetical protein [Halomonas sp. WWR20]
MSAESVSQERMTELLKGCRGGERVTVDYDGATYTGHVAGTSGVGIIFKAADVSDEDDSHQPDVPYDINGVEIQFIYVRELEKDGVTYTPLF